MGVLVALHRDRKTRYEGYLERRARHRTEFGNVPSVVERYESPLVDDGPRVRAVGYDPIRYYRLLGYEVDSVPTDEPTLADAFALTDDTERMWTVDDVAWMSEVCSEVGIDELADLCYAAVLFDQTCYATRA